MKSIIKRILGKNENENDNGNITDEHKFMLFEFNRKASLLKDQGGGVEEIVVKLMVGEAKLSAEMQKIFQCVPSVDLNEFIQSKKLEGITWFMRETAHLKPSDYDRILATYSKDEITSMLLK